MNAIETQVIKSAELVAGDAVVVAKDSNGNPIKFWIVKHPMSAGKVEFENIDQARVMPANVRIAKRANV